MADTGVRTPTVLWDQTYGVWSHYDVLSQPAVVLVDAAGNLVYAWDGAFDPDDALRRAQGV